MSYQGFTTDGIYAALHAVFPDGGAARYIGLLTAFGDEKDGSDVGKAAIARVSCNQWEDADLPVGEEETVPAIRNDAAVTFEALLADLTVVGFGIYAAASGGNPIAVGILLEDGELIASKDFTAGQAPSFGVGTLYIGINKMNLGG